MEFESGSPVLPKTKSHGKLSGLCEAGVKNGTNLLR